MRAYAIDRFGDLDRLSLREIRAGENPHETAKKAPDNAESLTAAAVISVMDIVSWDPTSSRARP